MVDFTGWRRWCPGELGEAIGGNGLKSASYTDTPKKGAKNRCKKWFGSADCDLGLLRCRWRPLDVLITNGVNGVNVNVDVSWPVFVVSTVTLDTSLLTKTASCHHCFFSVLCETFDSILTYHRRALGEDGRSGSLVARR